MKKRYVYQPKRYLTQVTLVGFVLLGALVVGLVKFLMNPGLNIWILVIVAAAYGSANTFLFKSNPNEVLFDDETVTFSSPYGKVVYTIDQLEDFNIREFAPNYQLFIRCRSKDGKHGRYWVNYYFFNDSKDMIQEFHYIERKIRPTALKFRGRPNMGAQRPGWSPAAVDDQGNPLPQPEEPEVKETPVQEVPAAEVPVQEAAPLPEQPAEAGSSAKEN